MKAIFFYIFITSLFFSSALARVNQCPKNFPDDCFCGEHYYDGTKAMFVVNCTNTGLKDTSILTQLPEQTEVLVFVGNHIDTLPSNIFGEVADLSELKIIDMSNNGIRDIKGKAFHHVLSVTRLVLNHNNISISEQYDKNYHHPRMFSNFLNLEELHLTNAFADNTDAALADDLHDIFVNSNLTKLYKLHLEQNEIKSFRDDRVFCDLPNLHDLYLGDNNIPNLNFNITCLPKLRYLDLEDNNITKFSQRDLDNFDHVTEPYRKQNFTLEIAGNPLRCEIAMKGLYSWLHTTKVTIRHLEKLQCTQAKYGQRYVMNLKAFMDSKHTRISQALTILLVVLVFILLTLLAAYVYLKKENVRHRLSPLFDAVSRKVQYTTIESQEV